jgi:hypothetical protein
MKKVNYNKYQPDDSWDSEEYTNTWEASRVIWLWEARRRKSIKQKFFNLIAKIYVSIWWKKQMKKYDNPRYFEWGEDHWE